MKQISLAATGFELVIKRTCKREFLDEMNLAVPWAELVGLIEPHAPLGKTRRPPCAVSTMLRIYFMQQWFGLSDPAMEEALHDVPLYCEFARVDAGITRLPDESTILRFRHLLEEHNLRIQIMVTINATLIAAPSSTKNSRGKRDPEMHQTKKGNQWHFGMKAHIGGRCRLWTGSHRHWHCGQCQRHRPGTRLAARQRKSVTTHSRGHCVNY